MLHIHNGDSTAKTAKKSEIPGEHLAWREALVCGPTPGGLSPDEFRKVRAKHLAAAYGVDLKECESDLRSQEAALSAFSDHEEVVLWFEHDLFCQVHLSYLLNWFARCELRKTKLSLISIGEFPGIENFRGLGQLNEDQLTQLFPQRQEVSDAQMTLGVRAWRAYASSDPAALTSLLDEDLSALPFLKRALRRHIERFPSTTNGLGRIENSGLDLIAKGYDKFKSLFPAFARRESEYGLGDAQLFLELKRLADGPTPLLMLRNGGKRARLDPVDMFLSSFQITELGQAVLNGDEDFVRRNGIDYWLGGVHLEGHESAWRYEMDAEELLARL